MSLQTFLAAWQLTGLAEKGYVNNPADPGGPTNYGITEKVARANGYMGDMRDLPRERAQNIAKAQYWDVLRLDDVGDLNIDIAKEMFDTGFLCGVGTAGMFLQKGLNSFNRDRRKGGPDYPEVKVDGLIGPATIYSLQAYLTRRGKDGVTVMLRCLNSQQGVYLMGTKNEEFMFGWFFNRVVI